MPTSAAIPAARPPRLRALGRLLAGLALALAIGLPVLRAWHVIHDHCGATAATTTTTSSLPGDAADADHCALCLALDARAEALPLDLALIDLPLPSATIAAPDRFLTVAAARPVFDRDARGPPISR